MPVCVSQVAGGDSIVCEFSGARNRAKMSLPHCTLIFKNCVFMLILTHNVGAGLNGQPVDRLLNDKKKAVAVEAAVGAGEDAHSSEEPTVH